MEKMNVMRLKDKKVIALVDTDFDDSEHWYPVLRLQEEGTQIDLVRPEAGKTYAGKAGVPATTDFAFSDVNADDYDGIIIPEGWAPDKLRHYPEVLQLVQDMDKAKKSIGQICHAGWVLVSANILQGKKVTSIPGIKDDLTNAGATWVDEPVVVDGHIISSRRPPDLPPYVKAYADKFAE